jgi:hypothetical protein
MRRLLFLLPALACGQAFAGNYATCILEKMPAVANDVAAMAVHQVCVRDNPGGLNAVEQGSGRGFFGFSSGAECTAKKAGDVRSNQAARVIGMSCKKLYDEHAPGLRPFTGKLDGE